MKKKLTALRRLALLTMTLLAATPSLFADDEVFDYWYDDMYSSERIEINGIWYDIYHEMVATVTYYEYTGPNDSNTGNTEYYVGDIEIPESFWVDGKGEYIVTSIGDRAFATCSKITSIKLPPSITSIGEGAFYLNSSLKSIDNMLNITSIGDSAFKDCINLESIGHMPELLTLGYDVFSGCEHLKIIGNMPKLNAIMDRTFYDCTSLESIGTMQTVNYVGEYAFNNCMSLQSVDFPTLNKICKSGFKGCRDLRTVYLPILSIIESAGFQHCSSLESVNCPNLSIIENNSFEYCSSLHSVGDMPKLTYIYSNAFSNCNNLQSIGEMRSLRSLGAYAFYNCINLQTVGEMRYITNIGNYAFYNCINLQSMSDMHYLTQIGAAAFSNCRNLKSFGIMPKLISIAEFAFQDVALEDIFLPTTVTSLGEAAFTYPTVVHFAGAKPPKVDGLSLNTLILVPNESVDLYKTSLKNMSVERILPDGFPTRYDVNVSALDSSSDVLNKINTGAEENLLYYVVSLKVYGSINSYDIMVIRNKMLNLRYLDLSDATIVMNSYEYVTGNGTEYNIIGNQMFKDLPLFSIQLPNHITKIKSEAFSGCTSLKELIIPDGVITIDTKAFSNCYALKKIILPQSLIALYGRDYDSSLKSNSGPFSNCISLENIVIPPSVQSIPRECFLNCTNLKTVSLPPTIKSIGQYAFFDCKALKEFRIPTGVNYIGNDAIPSSVTDVYTYTIQPTKIDQNTFGESTYKGATLHVPETSNYLYYWDTQWSQFQSITNFNEPYSYFYLKDADLVEDPDTPRIDGETDEDGNKVNPDADLGQGSGLVVEGDDSQNLGNVDLEHNGNGEGASIIGGDSNSTESGGNINIDMLNIKINVSKGKWYFFSFPFDVKCSDIKFNGQMAWRYYDGEVRALEGSGAWKDNKEDVLHRGIGYIFQGSKDGTLELSIPNASFDASDWEMKLTANVSAAAENASWNFIGNPFQSYYELADLGFDGPVTWWNPDTKSYEAYSPLDDDMTMYPFMAFFVQKPEGVDRVDFDAEYRETGNEAKDEKNKQNARARRQARTRAASERLLINLTVSDGETGDRTRVVFNDAASLDYEVGVDASKFLSADAPQIYTLNGSDVRFAINERPKADGTVRLGFYAPASAVYTIGCTRTDCAVTLTDLRAGKSVDLVPGQTYQFTADRGYDDNRFVISLKPDGTTAVDEAATPASDADYYQFNGLKTDGSARGMLIEKNGKDVKKVIK